MSVVPQLEVERHWTCPNCTTTAVTKRADVHSQFHACRGLKGLTAPLILDGDRAHVVAVTREDYVGHEAVQADGEGRPIMAVHTLRDDGYDCSVLAPAALATTNK